MKLQLKNLSGYGILSLGNFELDFSKLENQCVLFLGRNKDDSLSVSNGSGKSAILEALYWTIFGKTNRKLRYTDEIINLQTDSCQGKLIFSLNGKSYTVIRNKKKNDSTVLKIFEENKELLENADSKSKQSFLEKIVGFNPITFSTSIMFHQDFIAFPDLLPSERANILTEIGFLDNYVKAVIVTKNQVKDYDNQLIKCDYDKRNIESNIFKLEENDFSGKIQEFENQKIEDIVEVRREIRNIKIKSSEVEKENKKEISLLEDKIKENRKKISDSENDCKNKIDQIKGMEEKIKEINNLEKEEIEHRTNIKALEKEQYSYAIEIERLQKMEGAKCPTCLQEVTEKHLELCLPKIKEKITANKQQLSEKNAICVGICNRINIVNEELTILKRIKIDIDKIQAFIRTEEKTLFQNESRMKTLVFALSSNTEITERLIKEKENQIEKIKEHQNPYIDLEKQRQIDLEENKKALERTLNTIFQLTKQQQYYNFWIDGFKKVRLMLFDNLVARLNELVQGNLARYSSELGAKITGEKQTKSGTKDEVYIEVERPEGPISYGAFSGGERQKIKLAVSLALSQLIEEIYNRESNCVFFDEPNNNLDDAGKNVNFEIFSEIGKQGKTVIIIDHDAYFQDSFDKTFMVTKQDGISFIEELI